MLRHIRIPHRFDPADRTPFIGPPDLTIRLESPGPVIYRHVRVGRHGEPFELWKLRTMVPERMGAGLYIEPGDARTTRSG